MTTPKGNHGYQRLVITLIGIQTMILLAAVPWAMGIHASVASVKTSIAESLASVREVDDLETRIVRLETMAGITH